MSQTKIDKLTQQQEEQLAKHRKEWIEIGLRTGPTDRNATSKIIRLFYKRINQKPPYFYWCSSPLSAQFHIHLLNDKNANLHDNLHANLGANLRDNLFDNLHANLHANLFANLDDNLFANLRANLFDNLDANLHANLHANLFANLDANLRDNLLANLGANLHDNLRANLHANLLGNLRANLRANLGANLGANLRANLRDNLHDNLGANLHANLLANLGANLHDNLREIKYEQTYLWGSLESYWISYYLYPHKYLCKMHTREQMKLLNQWGVLAKSCLWWWPYEGAVFVSDRPDVINKDDRGRLHCTSGPSVAFSDGWSLYHYHGVEMPSDLICDHSLITPEKIDATSNIEVRRALIDLYGADSYIKESNAEKIGADQCGVLWRKKVARDEDMVFVEVINSTPEPDNSYKHYWLRVPPTTRTPAEAVAWTFGFENPMDYNPDVQT